MDLKTSQKSCINPVEKLDDFSPLDILQRIVQIEASGCLVVSYNSVTWRIYVQFGKLIYAHHSLDSFERLERHLRRLSNGEVLPLSGMVRNQARVNFDNDDQMMNNLPSEYQAINWLVEEKHLSSDQVAKMIKALSIEVFESFLLLTKAQYKFIKTTNNIPKFLRIDFKDFLIECKQRLEEWKALSPLILSPEQRPYFFNANQAVEKSVDEQAKKLSKLLRGFSFRQLAVLTNQDELKIAQYIHQFIQNELVLLREPQAPLDKLPQVPIRSISPQKKTIKIPEKDDFNHLSAASTSQKTYKIVCVDDSPTILREISRFLDQDNLSIKAISDPTKALIEIVRFKPDLILLDVGMPGIDGYKLCRLIRNHQLFKDTPCVMVTGNKGLIDRAKARVAGASDYLTKPFTQSDLLKIVFRHLT